MDGHGHVFLNDTFTSGNFWIRRHFIVDSVQLGRQIQNRQINSSCSHDVFYLITVFVADDGLSVWVSTSHYNDHDAGWLHIYCSRSIPAAVWSPQLYWISCSDAETFYFHRRHTRWTLRGFKDVDNQQANMNTTVGTDTLAESEYLHTVAPFPPNGVTQCRVKERFPWQPWRGYRVHCTE